MASPVSALLGSPTTSNGTAPTATAQSNSTPDKQMFLQLLVSQIKNQDPLNPVDGTQFVAQLAQFSQLEQLIGIRSDLDNQNANAAGTGTTNVNMPAGTTDPNAGGASSTAPTSSTTNQN